MQAGEWTQAAIAKTQDEIKRGIIKVSSELTDFAQTSVLPCVRLVADKAKCGTSIVTSTTLCGYDVAKDGAKCGIDFVTDGAKCGSKLVADGVNCGIETVTDVARCGGETITDGARCGTKVVTDAVACGVDYVKTGWECVTCGFTCDACKSPKTCTVANTCTLPKSCSAPKTCNIANTCGIPRTCNIAKSCTVEKSCWVSDANCNGSGSSSGGNITPPPSGSATSVNMELIMSKDVAVTSQMIADFKTAVAKHTGIAIDIINISISNSKVQISISNLRSYAVAYVAQNSLQTSLKNGMFQKDLAQYSSLSQVSVNSDLISTVEHFSSAPSAPSSGGGNPVGVALGVIFALGFVALAAFGFISHKNGTLPGKIEKIKGIIKLPSKSSSKPATDLTGVNVVTNPLGTAKGTTAHWSNVAK